MICFVPGLARLQKTVKSVRSDIATKLNGGARRTHNTEELVDHNRGSSGCSINTDSESLEDLVRTLHRQIKDSDWLKENTAEKWAAENPVLAQAFLHQETKCTEK